MAAEMRQSLGTADLVGMLGVTMFGLLFAPTFYVLIRCIASWLGRLRRQPKRILLASTSQERRGRVPRSG